MTIVMTGRNYEASSNFVSIFGRQSYRDGRDESNMVEFQPMVAEIINQAIEAGDVLGSIKVMISPRIASMMLVSGQLVCHPHLATALEGDDYIEVRDFMVVGGHSVALRIVRDMEADIELWSGQDLMVDQLPMFDGC